MVPMIAPVVAVMPAMAYFFHTGNFRLRGRVGLRRGSARDGCLRRLGSGNRQCRDTSSGEKFQFVGHGILLSCSVIWLNDLSLIAFPLVAIMTARP